MAPSKNYQQPYSSRHVLNDTRDPIRSEDLAYIKNFPHFLHLLYSRQTPFDRTILITSRQMAKSSGRSDGKNKSPARSPQPRRPQSPAPPPATRDKSATVSDTVTDKSLQTQQQEKQQSAGFKTLGAKAKSPTVAMSKVPSDFEHIFHYSETQ